MVEGTYKYEHKYDIRCHLTFWLINLPLSLAMAPHTLFLRKQKGFKAQLSYSLGPETAVKTPGSLHNLNSGWT